MLRHQKFLELHREFIEGVQEYVRENDLDYALIIGDKDDVVVPWSIKFPQNKEILMKIIKELDAQPVGAFHCEHYENEKEFEKRVDELGINEVEIHKQPVIN